MKNYDIIIIGSGPAGLTAAKAAAEQGRSVLVLERNKETARKLYATGNGRCNFMNLNMDGAEELLRYCNSIGIIEAPAEDGRLYPRNHQAASVVKIMSFAAEKAGAQIKTDTQVTFVQKKEHGFELKLVTGELLSADKVLIATGGKAGIQYGCYGDGYKWAEGFGHTIIKPIPALTGLECAEDISMLHGVRLYAKASLLSSGAASDAMAGAAEKDAVPASESKDTVIAEDTGEVQFTKDGISGICVMNLSRYLRFEDGKSFTLRLDLYPEYTQEELLSLFLRQIKAAGCAMEGLVPVKMHDYLHTRIDPDVHNPVTMSKLSKCLDFTVTGSKGWKIAQVTSGGVPLDEVTENCESKLMPGLFFAGEILDYDGPCGGYNIGFAIRTGLIAGAAMAK